MQYCDHCKQPIDLSCDTPHDIKDEVMTVCEGCYNDYVTFKSLDFGDKYRGYCIHKQTVKERAVV